MNIKLTDAHINWLFRGDKNSQLCYEKLNFKKHKNVVWVWFGLCWEKKMYEIGIIS